MYFIILWRMKTPTYPASLPALLFLCALLFPGGLYAHQGDDHETAAEPAGGRVLGTISFATSTRSPEAQQAFIEGALLLHLFEYPFARDQFLKAQEIDPGFAMAYWGEAMTHNHPIWDSQDLAAGRQALAKLGATPDQRLSAAPSERERGFIMALELLYGAGTKAQRDVAYMRAMEALAANYPGDQEAQLFYALSLFGVKAGLEKDELARYNRQKLDQIWHGADERVISRLP
mgnify:CR=1 FL=1